MVLHLSIHHEIDLHCFCPLYLILQQLEDYWASRGFQKEIQGVPPDLQPVARLRFPDVCLRDVRTASRNFELRARDPHRAGRIEARQVPESNVRTAEQELTLADMPVGHLHHFDHGVLLHVRLAETEAGVDEPLLE